MCSSQDVGSILNVAHGFASTLNGSSKVRNFSSVILTTFLDFGKRTVLCFETFNSAIVVGRFYKNRNYNM